MSVCEPKLTEDRTAQLRQQIKGWLRDNLRPEWVRTGFPRHFAPGENAQEIEIARLWHQRLHAGGWLATAWPAEHGGSGLSLEEQVIVRQELAAARAPVPVGFNAIDILGPALMAYGNEQQCRRFLPRILTAEDIWCQGYSEPDAGSDLAALRTRANRDGDCYIVNGQKVWTSYGHTADWCFLLARTGEPDSKHRGISFFLVEMTTPGISWRPLRQATGEQEFGELFLDNVVIPAEQRVGEEGIGWRVAMHSLSHERLSAANLAAVQARLDGLLELVRTRPPTSSQRQRVAELYSRFRTMEGVLERALAMSQRKDPRFAAFASVIKILGTELGVDIANLGLEVIGAEGLASGPSRNHGTTVASALGALWAEELIEARAGPIYAGTNDIQRNIVAEIGLGLPR